MPDQRTLPRVFTAALTAVVLALAAPAGFVLARPSEHPVATLSSKVWLASDDE